MHIQRHVVLVGAGRIGLQIFNDLPTEWSITVIDKDMKLLNRLPDEWGGKPVVKLCADATSRLVLQEANLSPTTMLAILTDSDDVNTEVANIAKEHFQVEEIFVIQREIGNNVSIDNTQVINVFSLIANRVSNLMKGTLSAQGVGQERGEIRQVTVLNSSPARGLTIKELNPVKWHIAAIYREGNLVMPTGDEIIRIGDQVIVVGEPEQLEAEIPFLHGGQILFPTQYGNTLGYFQTDKTKETVAVFLEKTEATTSLELMYSTLSSEKRSGDEIRQRMIQDDIGMIIMPPQKIPWFHLWGMGKSPIMNLMFHAQIPFLLLRGEPKFKKILLCVNKYRSIRVLGAIAFDIVRQFDAELTILSIFAPNIDKSQQDKIESIPTEMEKLARTHGVSVHKKHSEGNPIKEIRRIAEEYDLLLVGYSQHDRSTITNPDISLHLYHQSPCSVLFVPWQTAGR